MDSPCIKQTVCKVFKIFQCGKYLVAYVLKAVFAEGINNGIADSISCFQIQRFRQLAPQAEQTPEAYIPFKDLIYP